jgi:Nif-specific regulatory protein
MRPEIHVHDTEKLLILFDLSRAFSTLMELDELLELINAETKKVLEAESSAILLVDEATGELFFPVSGDASPEREERFRAIRFPADKGIAGWVVENSKAVIVPDVTKDGRFYPEIDRLSGAWTTSLLYAPLRTRRGVLGVIGVRNKRSGHFTEEDLRFLEALSGGIAVAIENARLYSQLKDSEARLRTQVGALRRDLARRDRFSEIIGTGGAMLEVFRLMESAAASPLAVLIEGETGTGKELVARGIHRESERANAPFLGVSCAALADSLLEAELFGHRRGAFTGATEDKRGLFEAATGGTLFLDEIGEAPAAMQAKLLRVLQEGEIIPVGDSRPRKVDVRIISATNRDLGAEVSANRFRADLYYRLGAFPIRLPPLRERTEDIPVFADRIVAMAGERSSKRIRGIDREALELILRFAWPGNVRELQNEIERAVAIAHDGETITPTHLSAKLRKTAASDATSAPALRAPSENGKSIGWRESRATFEAGLIAEVLKQHGGNVSRAAQALGVSRVTLHKKLKDYGLR